MSDEVTAKLCIVGESNVGKTCLLQRFLSNRYSDGSVATIGAAFARKQISVDEDVSVVLEIWDTAGQERFRSMAPQYFRGCSVALCVFQCDDMGSLEALRDWVGELQRHALDDLKIVLLASKCDLVKQGDAISDSKRAEVADAVMQNAERFRRDLGAPRIALTSAKTAQGIVALFERITTLVLEQDEQRRHTHRSIVIGSKTQPRRSLILDQLEVKRGDGERGCCS